MTSKRPPRVYAEAERVIVCYGMGITQQRHGTANVQQIANLLLLRGNIGKPGAGMSPLRGHSNVQGDRTMGINHAPPESFLQRLGAHFDFEPPRKPGHTVLDAIPAMVRGDSQALICLGGNLAVAAPDPDTTFAALRETEADRAHRHQAQPHPSGARAAIDPSALPGASARSTARRSGEPSRHGRGLDVHGARIGGLPQTGLGANCAPNARSLPGSAQATLPRQRHRLAAIGRRLRPYPRCDRRRAAGAVRRLQPAPRRSPGLLPCAIPRASASGIRPAARPSSSQPMAWPKTKHCHDQGRADPDHSAQP